MNSYLQRIINLLAGNFFNKMVLFLFLPIFTKFLLPQEYAVYANLTIFFSFAGMLYFMGMQQALFSYFYKEDRAEYRFSLICSLYLTLIALGLLFSSLIIIFREPLALFITLSTANSHLLIIMAAILFMNMLFSISMSLYNIMEKSNHYIGFTAGNNLLFIILLALAALSGNFRLEIIFSAQLIAVSLLAVLAVSKLGKDIWQQPLQEKIYFDAKIIRPMLSFGLIMLPATLAMLLMRMADRYMITYFDPNNLQATGIYAVSYKLGTLVQLVVSVVSIIYFPYVLKLKDKLKQYSSFRQIMDYYLWIGFIVAALAIAFTPEIYALLVQGDFSVGAKITFIGIISTYLHGIFNIINLPFYANKKAGKIALAVIAGSIINILLNAWLIPRFSLLGAGIASILAYLIIISYNLIMVEKMYKIRFRIAKFLPIALLLAALSYYNYLSEFSPVALLGKILVSLLVVAGVSLVLHKNGKLHQFRKMLGR